MEMSFLGGKSWKLLPWKNNSQQLILKLKTTQKLMTNKKNHNWEDNKHSLFYSGNYNNQQSTLHGYILQDEWLNSTYVVQHKDSIERRRDNWMILLCTIKNNKTI